MAKKKIEVELPDYFSLKHYKAMSNHEHLDELDRVVYTLVATTEHTHEEVMRWNISDMLKVYQGVAGMLDSVPQEFYPVFEWKGQTFGFQPLSKLSVAEWIDLDKRLDSPVENLEQVLAILYRPIVEDKFDGMKWQVKSSIKTLLGKRENIFNYYTIEEYDTEKRDWRAEMFEDLPLGLALGCLTFFLGFALMLQKTLVLSSPVMEEMEKKEMSNAIEQALQSLNTSDGSTYFATSVLKSYTSQEKNPS